MKTHESRVHQPASDILRVSHERRHFASGCIIEQRQEATAFVGGCSLHEIGYVVQRKQTDPHETLAWGHVQDHRDLFRRIQLQEVIVRRAMKRSGWRRTRVVWHGGIFAGPKTGLG